ncbi:MAG TPA: trigger factor [Firmicutes bacterium]|nr:trigger factor [Bacillota bacterium]
MRFIYAGLAFSTPAGRISTRAGGTESRDGEQGGEIRGMKASVEKRDKNVVALTVEVPAEEVEQAVERAYRRLLPRLRIPGFRPGKAPRSVVEARLGREYLLNEAVEDMVPRAYESAVREYALEPVERPRIKLTQAEPGKPLIFEAQVTVTPEVELGEYRGLEVERPVRAVTEADVERVLDSLQERAAQLVVVERPVQAGDFATIDFAGLLEGKPFRGGAASDYVLEVGRGAFPADFENALIGMKAGETRTVPVRFPDQYSNPELAGKEVQFTVTVKAVREKRVPPRDDELARTVGEFETLEQLRQDIRQRLEQQAEAEAEEKVREALVRRVTSEARVEIPQVMIDRGIDRMLRRFEESLAYRGMTLERYLDVAGKTLEQLRSELAPSATEMVKSELCLAAIARREGLTATEEEVREEVERRVGLARDEKEAKELRELWEGEAGKELIRETIEERKAIRFLRDQARVNTVIVAEPEPAAEPGKEGEEAPRAPQAGSPAREASGEQDASG